MVVVILEALDHILAAGAQSSMHTATENPYLRLVEEADGLTLVEQLQSDDNEDVYKKAVKVLEYFPQEGEEEEESQTFGGSAGLGGFNFQAMQQ